MPDLLIKEAELKQLDQLLMPIPLQFGYPLVTFINQVATARANEAKIAGLGLKESPKEEKVKKYPPPPSEQSPTDPVTEGMTCVA
jgi:hypothetical protein